MTDIKSIMSLPLASKFPGTAELAIHKGVSVGEAMAMLETKNAQDGARADAILSLTDASEYQTLLHAMVNVPRINASVAKELLGAMLKQQGRENNIDAIPEKHTTDNRPANAHADAGYTGEGYDADTIDRILKTI